MLHTLCGKIGKSLHEAAPNTCSFGLRPLVEPVLHISIPFTPFPVLHGRMSVGELSQEWLADGHAREGGELSATALSRGGRRLDAQANGAEHAPQLKAALPARAAR